MSAAMSAAANTRPSRAARVLGPFHVLIGNRDLDLLIGGQIVSSFGDWLYITALVILVYNLTHSAAIAAALTFVRLLPNAIFLALSGVLADRFNPKALMIIADLGRCACMLGLLAVTSQATVWIAFPLVFISTCLFSLFRPAMGKVLPAVVGDPEKLVQANSLKNQIDGLSLSLGPSLTGVLVLLGHVQVAFAINAATYLVSAATLFLIRVQAAPRAMRPAERGWRAELVAGYSFLFRENQGVLGAAALGVAGLTLFLGASWTLYVVLSVQSLHMGSQGAGFLSTAYGLGALVGGFLTGPIVSRFRVTPGFIASLAICAVAIALFGLSPIGVLAFLFLGLLGVGDALADIFGTTILQTATPQELLGRVFGAYRSIHIFAMLLGTLAVGPLIGLLGPRATTVVLALLDLAIVLLFLPRLRQLEATLGVRIFLRQVPILIMLSRLGLDDLAQRLQLECAQDGATIVHQGESGDKLYIIKQGDVEVVAHGDSGRDVRLATLSKMDYFGEIALLRDVPRTASVVARGPVELYSLSRADFQELTAQYSDLRAALLGTSDTRYYETQTRLLM